jgi:methyl acetate hydrolase
MKKVLDALLQAGIDRGAAPGVSAVLVDRDGVKYEGAFGERVIGSGVKMEVDTVGAIFSMTKAITGAAVMQLVEQGKLSLDVPAGDVCPEIGEVTVLDGFDHQGQPITRPPARPVTLRHLLTHTSGYAYDIWDAECARWHEVTGTPTVFSKEKASLRAPLMFDPGTRWEYGIGVDWAGQMVEVGSGMTLEEYFAKYLTGPLGMNDTAFVSSPSMLDRAAGLHVRHTDGSLEPYDLAPAENPEFELGGGGLYGTMSDYGRFIRMILNNGELDGIRVLSAETVAQMCRNHIGELRVEELKTCDPALSNNTELFPGVPKSWGLTFQINETEAPTGQPAGALMWAGLANSFYWIDRENGIGGAYLSQILPLGDEGSVNLFYELETAVYSMLPDSS